jgi:poly(ADP-ribose)glycohydrolase PARG
MAAPLDESCLLLRAAFEARELAIKHPPRLTHANKKLVHALACPPDAPLAGTITLSRWRAMPLPTTLPAAAPEHEMREDVFGYESVPAGTRPLVEWYVNFADRSLFVAYGGPLLAQDEMQVAEHPALGSLREALKASNDPRLAPLTRDNDGPTPILLRGVERRCAIDTEPDLLAGRIQGLYGNNFARARPDAIRSAVTVLQPPTITNLLAMEAPPGGNGRYAQREIEDVLTTAYTGFRAAEIESALEAESPTVTVHTGHWGTGAYGGNRVLMALLQRIAARLAGLDRLVFHTFDAEGSRAWEQARDLEQELAAPGASVDITMLIGAIESRGFTWGVSDGN